MITRIRDFQDFPSPEDIIGQDKSTCPEFWKNQSVIIQV